jgi:hypothetical protein
MAPPEADDRDRDDRDDRRARRPRLPPARLKWQEGDPIPPGYAPKHRANVGLLVTGAVLFGVSYLPSLGIAASSDENDDEYLPLAIPVAGPFVTIATADSEGAGTFWLAMDGVTQATGLTLFIASFVAKTSYLRRISEAPTSPGANLAVGPGSLGVRGAF